jgi:hypothetical protein
MGDQSFEGGAIADLRVYGRVLSEADASLLAQWPAIELARDKSADALSGAERDGLRQYHLTREFADHMDVAGELQILDAEKLEIVRRGALTHVQHEQAGMPSAHLLPGMYDQPREKLAANTPYALPPMSAALPKSLGLARWLVDPAHPLTARVAVNRMWQELFGTGLVKTSDDFGSQGEPPSHPELLDWLAGGVPRERVGREAPVQADGDLGGVPAGGRSDAVEDREGSREPAAFARSAVPHGCRDDPGLRTGGERFVNAHHRRPVGEAVPAAGCLGGGGDAGVRTRASISATAARRSTAVRSIRSGSAARRRRRWRCSNAPTRENCTVRRERTNTPLQALVTMERRAVCRSGAAPGAAGRGWRRRRASKSRFSTWRCG